MTISQEQLENWAREVSNEAAERSLASIEAALQSYEWPNGIEYQVRLHGSCANKTNLTDSSDAEVLILLKTVFISNVRAQQRLLAGYRQTWYRYQDFMIDVKIALEDAYGVSTVSESGEFFKLSSESLPLPVNVLPCIIYFRFKGADFSEDRLEGVSFLTTAEAGAQKQDDWMPSDIPIMGFGKIINQGNTTLRWARRFPQFHERNGCQKDENTGFRYKAMIRIFKSIRDVLVKTDADADISSFFLESLLYNVPDRLFAGDYADSFFAVLEWLSTAELDNFLCQNGCEYLFQCKSGQWQRAKAVAFIEKVTNSWNNS